MRINDEGIDVRRAKRRLPLAVAMMPAALAVTIGLAGCLPGPGSQAGGGAPTAAPTSALAPIASAPPTTPAAEAPASPSGAPSGGATPATPPGNVPPSAAAATGTPSPGTDTGAYGSIVDEVDDALPKLQVPGPLPSRPDGEVTAVAGKYQNPVPGYIGGKYVMMYRDDHVTLRGAGYIQVRYEIAWFNRPGSMVMPTWTGLRGKLFHVASGGLRRMDDPKPNDLPDTDTWMGEPDRGYVVLPEGAQQMWQNEFFYLDGEVTLHNNERGADYNITATPKTWAQVTADITTPPPADPEAAGWVRYGLVRDTGDDSAPVPQYVTRDTPTDPATVPQKTQV